MRLVLFLALTMVAQAATVAELEAVPEADRHTRAHQADLALAFQAENKPGPAGEAVATHDLLPPGPAADLDAVRKWLTTKALEEYKAALAAKAKGDASASVRGYVRAILLDPALQARDDQGLRALAETSLDGAVKKKPTDAPLRYKHALLQYHFGNLPAAKASLAEYLKIEKSPYHAWRGGLWQTKVHAELGTIAKQDEKNAQEAAAGRVKQAAEDAAAEARAAKAKEEAANSAAAAASAEPGPPPGALSPEGEARKKAIESELEKLDLAIAAAQNLDVVKGAAGKYGNLVDKFANSPAAQARVQAMKNDRERLKKEMSELK